MKRLALCLAAVIALSSSAARADVYLVRSDRYDPNMLLVNVGDLLGGVVSLEYERALSPWFGLTAGFSAWSFRGLFTPPSDPYFTALTFELGARFHFIRDAPGGLWVGPMVTGGLLLARSDRAVGTPFAWGLGAAAGYNFIIGRHFTLQLGVGGGFTDYGDRLVWYPRFRLGVGAVF